MTVKTVALSKQMSYTDRLWNLCAVGGLGTRNNARALGADADAEIAAAEARAQRAEQALRELIAVVGKANREVGMNWGHCFDELMAALAAARAIVEQATG